MKNKPDPLGMKNHVMVLGRRVPIARYSSNIGHALRVLLSRLLRLMGLIVLNGRAELSIGPVIYFKHSIRDVFRECEGADKLYKRE